LAALLRFGRSTMIPDSCRNEHSHAGPVMVQSFLALRYVMLLAALGAALGALLMFWEGGAELASAAGAIGGPRAGKGVAAHVMHATDAILFGIVLIIFAYAIAFGLVINLPPEVRRSVPAWMQSESVGHLKQSLIEVILVYMVVDVATDWSESDVRLDAWSLIKPVSIILIAAALRLLGRPGDAATPSP
jgi:uncharacterized membrane protein YqhA